MYYASVDKRLFGRNLLGLLGLSALLDKVATESAWHAQAEKERGGGWLVGGAKVHFKMSKDQDPLCMCGCA